MQFELGLKINECVSNSTPGLTTDLSFEVLNPDEPQESIRRSLNFTSFLSTNKIN